MRHRTKTYALIATLVLLAAACGDDDAGTTAAPTTAATAAPTTTEAPATSAAPTTSEAPATTVAPATTTTAEPMGAITSDGSDYHIDWSMATPFFAPPAAGSGDPFYQLHSDPAADGFFLSVEAYTVYGTAWTGELGTFEIDCSPAGTGICVHFDPDGAGPEGNAGADFAATGQITFHELGPDGFRATLENVQFSNGITISGPLELSG